MVLVLYLCMIDAQNTFDLPQKLWFSFCLFGVSLLFVFSMEHNWEGKA